MADQCETMENDAATLQCSNDLCKAPNCQTDKFCQECGTFLSKRYLWAVGEGIEAYKVGELIAERYLIKNHHILLDTKPGLLPETPEEITNGIKAYLRLVPYRLQVPQVYGLVSLSPAQAKRILLLEQAPIYIEGTPLAGQLMPKLLDKWQEATSMRQLNWLWQIAQLWEPCSAELVGSSLLDYELLRVEGSLVRLLELPADLDSAPTLAQLGELWSQLISSARPGIASFLEQLCHCLINKEIDSANDLIAVLDRGLNECGRSQLQTIQIATYTDTGPSRQRNEDACYPPSGTIIKATTSSDSPIAIVCDGIGGHQGGNVASNLAIETLQQQFEQKKLNDPQLEATTLSIELENAACVANERISDRNDTEKRSGRQRMGTTLVMALARAHEIYITHVGDSRAYWITQTGCHQVTLDDDVASREVRLGYALYRDALQQQFSGSLVQALGMGSSLYPTVQRFIIDEDYVFLLCSDGLSDYDRVEQYWETDILPLLNGNVDIATAGLRLVEIANTQNGHDNVTVGLIYCQVKSSEPESALSPSLTNFATATSNSASTVAITLQTTNTKDAVADTSPVNTQLLLSKATPRRSLVLMLLGLVMLSIGGLAYVFKQPLITLVKPESNRSRNVTTESLEIPGNVSSKSLDFGSLFQIKNLTADSQNKINSFWLRQGPQPPLNQATIGQIPDGSVLQVIGKQTTSSNDDWLRLKICSIPSEKQTVTQSQLVQPGDEGWIRATKIKSSFLLVSSLQASPLGNCIAPSTPSSELTTSVPAPSQGTQQKKIFEKPAAAPNLEEN